MNHLSSGYTSGSTDTLAWVEPVPNDPEKRTWAELIAEAQVRDAVRGNVQAARAIAVRTEGTARQAIAFDDRTLAQAFARMTREELEAFARDGTLPRWFPQTQGRAPNASPEADTDGWSLDGTAIGCHRLPYQA